MKIKYEIHHHGIGVITLSHPPQNALTRPAFETPENLSSFFEKPELKAVILKGDKRHFCSGADLKSLELGLGDIPTFESELEEAQKLTDLLYFAPIPVVASIRGSCLGGGLEIALACHFRIASDNALFGFPETTHGLIPGLGGATLASEILPRSVVTELILSGRIFGAHEASELGLVDRVVSTSELEAATFDFLEKLVGNRDHHVIRAAVSAINNARRLPRQEALQAEGKLFLEVARRSAFCSERHEDDKKQ